MTQSVFPRFVPQSLAMDGWWLTTTTQSGVDGPCRTGGMGALGQRLPPIGLSIAALIILADWLFWDRAIGISLALFSLAIVGLAIWLTRSIATHELRLWAAFSVVAGVLPVINAIGFFPICFLLLGTITAVLILHRRLSRHVWQNLRTYLWFLVTGPVWIIIDAIKPAKDISIELPTTRILNAWIIPVGVGLIFLALFAEANPVFEEMILNVLDIEWIRSINLGRIFFWAGMACLCWPFLNMRKGRATQSKPARTQLVAPLWFDQTAIRNALVLFNAIFAIQSTLDLSFLWGGLSLPDELTYAEYAHRGAYPLLATSLLAGIFMLAATSFGPVNTNLKRLLFVWIGQNVALVVSSVLRLNLYVAFYSLTYMRVAAFIWMGLVLMGLILIAYRLARDHSNGWVLSRIAGVGLITLYLGCFANFAIIIAQYNVSHAREISGEGLALDRDYLCGLGAAAYPAADRFLKATGSPIEGFHRDHGRSAGWLADDFWRHQENWRDWGLRDARLARYLHAQY